MFLGQCHEQNGKIEKMRYTMDEPSPSLRYTRPINSREP